MDSTIDNDRKVSLSLKRMREKEDQKVKRKHKKREKIGEKNVSYDNIINNIKNLNQDNEVIEIKENEEEKNENNIQIYKSPTFCTKRELRMLQSKTKYKSKSQPRLNNEMI